MQEADVRSRVNCPVPDPSDLRSPGRIWRRSPVGSYHRWDLPDEPLRAIVRFCCHGSPLCRLILRFPGCSPARIDSFEKPDTRRCDEQRYHNFRNRGGRFRDIPLQGWSDQYHSAYGCQHKHVSHRRHTMAEILDPFAWANLEKITCRFISSMGSSG